MFLGKERDAGKQKSRRARALRDERYVEEMVRTGDSPRLSSLLQMMY